MSSRASPGNRDIAREMDPLPDADAVREARKLVERAPADDIGAEPPMLLTTRQAGWALGAAHSPQ